MKASELKPGQFFEFVGTRYVVVGIDKNSPHLLCCVCQTGRKFEITWIIAQNEVTPLAVTGWDDEPSMSTGPIPQGWACMMNTQTGEKRLVPCDEVFPPDPPKLQLREGAYYRRRDGEVVGPLYKTDNDECPECPWRASDIRDNPYRSWSHDGKYDPDETEPDDYDLIAEAPPVEHVRPAIADAIENAAAAFHQKIKEPEQFAAGDWVVPLEDHPQTKGNRPHYVQDAINDLISVNGLWWGREHFRRATPAEIAEQQRKDYWQHPVVENKPDADDWIEHDGKGCPVDLNAKVLIRCRHFPDDEHGPFVASAVDWRDDDRVNPPTPELQPIYTTHVQYVGVL